MANQFGKELVEHCFNWTVEHIQSQNPFPSHLGVTLTNILFPCRRPSCDTHSIQARKYTSVFPLPRTVLPITTPSLYTPSEKLKVESGQSASLPVWYFFVSSSSLSWTGGSAFDERNLNKQKCLENPESLCRGISGMGKRPVQIIMPFEEYLILACCCGVESLPVPRHTSPGMGETGSCFIHFDCVAKIR